MQISILQTCGNQMPNEMDDLMSERSHGLYAGRSRHLARHHKPSRLTIRDQIKEFKEGDKVVVVPKGAFKDIPHPRYRGRVGVVLRKSGSAYVVEMYVSKSTKRILTVPQRHLEKAR